MEAVVAADAPVIVQASIAARKYAGSRFLSHLIKAAVMGFQIPRCLCTKIMAHSRLCVSNRFNSVSYR